MPPLRYSLPCFFSGDPGTPVTLRRGPAAISASRQACSVKRISLTFPPYSSMDTLIDRLIAAEALSPEERQRVRKAVAADANLQRSLRQWLSVCSRIEEEIEEAVEDHRILIYYALVEDGRGEALTEEEASLLQEAADDVEAALQRHPALQDVVNEIQDACETFDSVWATHTAGSADRAADRSLLRAADRGAQPLRRSPRRAKWLVGAAAAAILIGVALLLFWPTDAPMETVQVAEGEVETVVLPDGSEVRLRGPAQLSHDAEEFDRTVSVEGQAYFTVQPTIQTFRAHTPTAEVRVLGTAFGVEAAHNRTRVVISDGRVAFSSSGEEVTLEAGQESEAGAGETPARAITVDLQEELAWTGMLFFRETPMEEVARLLEEHRDTGVVVAEALHEEKVTGTFAPEDTVEDIARTLAATLGISMRVDAATDEIYLEP